MIIYNILIINLILILVNSSPLQYSVLNSNLKCIDYKCTKCDNFFDGLIDDVIECAQNYITNTNEKNYLEFIPASEVIDNDEYDCASFKVKMNPKNGLYEDEETKITYDKNQLIMTIKDTINKSNCQCTFTYINNND